MSIDEVDYDGTLAPAFAFPHETAKATSCPHDSAVHQMAIRAFRLGSYLVEPACQVHELWRRISIVEGSPVEKVVEKVSICLMMAGWFALSLFTTLPGLVLR